MCLTVVINSCTSMAWIKRKFQSSSDVRNGGNVQAAQQQGFHLLVSSFFGRFWFRSTPGPPKRTFTENLKLFQSSGSPGHGNRAGTLRRRHGHGGATCTGPEAWAGEAGVGICLPDRKGLSVRWRPDSRRSRRLRRRRDDGCGSERTSSEGPGLAREFDVGRGEGSGSGPGPAVAATG